MPGITQKFETGPKTYEVKVAVTGGMAVEYASGTPTQAGLSLVQPAAAGSTKFAGVAQKDAYPNSAQAGLQGFTSNDGYPAINIAVPSESVAVYKRGEVPVQYAAAANYGDKLKCAAAGQVTPWIAGTDDPSLICGRCEEQAGVALGAWGKTWINVL